MSTRETSKRVPEEKLRDEIQDEYTDVADNPSGDFHFHTGRNLAVRILGYPENHVDALPNEVVESFAGTGNPFTPGEPQPGGADR